ncbi:MAG: glycosyltransferase, partial [Methanobacterium sp.]
IGANIDNYIVTVNNTPEEGLFKKKNKIKDDNKKFTIFLGGKITEQRSTELIISAIKDMEDVQLIIKGFCAEEDYIANLLEMTADMENVDMCLDGVPYEEITKNTLNADLTIALYDPNIPNNKYASPNKLFEAMASEIPIIVNENTSMADIVKKENCGIIIPFKNEKALKSAISSLKEDQKLRKKLGYNGRKAFENKYNWTIMEERLINIYDHVLS